MIGKNIEAARLRLGLNQSELARLLGVSPQSVQQWEAGETEPRRKRIQAIAECLNTTVAEIEFGTSLTKVEKPTAKLSETESVLITAFRKMDESMQKNLLLIIESLAVREEVQPDNALEEGLKRSKG